MNCGSQNPASLSAQREVPDGDTHRSISSNSVGTLHHLKIKNTMQMSLCAAGPFWSQLGLTVFNWKGVVVFSGLALDGQRGGHNYF